MVPLSEVFSPTKNMVTKICSVKFEASAMTCGLSDPRSIWICWAAPLKAFLPRANGEVGRGSVGKGNFVKLRKAVSLDDQIITEEKTQMESQFYLIIFIRLNSCRDLKYVVPFPDDYLTGL